ncbi:MAG: cytochrome P450 [Flavobacteriales bacterium]|nr:cytochrome P450 [Flavobacteriales bacterium]
MKNIMTNSECILNPGLFVKGIPHEIFEHYRKNAPLFRDKDTMNADRIVWNLVRYNDVLAGLKNVQVFSIQNHNELHEQTNSFGDSHHWHPKAMSLLESPEHTIHKKRFSSIAKKVNTDAYRVVVSELANELVSNLSNRGEFDAVDDFSAILTSQIVCSYFKIPKENHEFFRRLSSVFMGDTLLNAEVGSFSVYANKCPFNINETSPARNAMDMIKNYWGDAPWLDESFVKTADRWEVEDLGLQMFSAGMAGLRNCITMGVYYLSLNWKELKDNSNLWLSNIDLITEEIIRLTTPLMRIRRVLSSDIEMYGQEMKKDDHVFLWLASANTDPTVFQNPLEFVPFRSPNPHLSFSSGIHSCLGFSLARMEVEEVLKSIIINWKKLELVDSPVRFKSSVVNEISSMKIKIGA